MCFQELEPGKNLPTVLKICSNVTSPKETLLCIIHEMIDIKIIESYFKNSLNGKFRKM